MKYKSNLIIVVSMISVFAIITSFSFLVKDKVFAQSNILGDNSGGLFGNLFKSFGTFGSPNSTPSTAPSTSSNPFSSMLGSALSPTSSSSPIEKSSTPSSDKVKFHVGEQYKGFTFNHKKASESKAKKACDGNNECIGCIDHRAQLNNELTGYEAVKCLKDPQHSY
jgi:hypothetical protein